MGGPADLEQLLSAFAALVAEHEAKAAPEGESEDDQNFRCVDCTDCSSCRFCTACERCVDCTYCDACIDCEGCTQSRECLGCASVSQSNHSAYCEQSSYLTLCLDCDTCVQCFACVGLSGAEFHILNQKYRRGEYFKKVNELRTALDAKTLEGWFPPWAEANGTEGSSAEGSSAEAGTTMSPAPARPARPPEEPTGTTPADEPAPEQTGEVAEAPMVGVGVPKVIETASEYTGSWPPADHASARALDRHRSADEAWRELEEEGSQAFSSASSVKPDPRPTPEPPFDPAPSQQAPAPSQQAPAPSQQAPAPSPRDPAPSKASPAPAPKPAVPQPSPSRFSDKPVSPPSRFGGLAVPAPSPPTGRPMGAGLLPDELVDDSPAAGRFDRAFLKPPQTWGQPEPRVRDESPSLRSATRPTRPSRPDE